MLVVSIPLITEMDLIIGLWLGSKSHETVLFCQLMIIYVDCLALQGPITTIIQAIGKIKDYHLPVETVTLMCLPISYIFFMLGGNSYTIFYAIIGVCLIAQVIRVWCLKRFYSYFSLQQYIYSFVCPSLIVICGVIFTELLIRSIDMAVPIRIITHCFLLPLIVVLFIAIIGMDKTEKKFLMSMVRKTKQ